MKTRILMITALVISTMTFAQKKEIKALEKAIKSGSYGEAKTLVSAAESLLSGMDEKTKEKFQLLKAQSFLGVDNTDITDLMKAGEAFTALKDTKFSAEAVTGLTNVAAAMVNSAVKDQNANKFAEAGKKLQEAFKFSGGNKDYLFFAASNFLNAKDYGKASTIFQGLLDDGYKGQREEFYAVNAATGEEKLFDNKQERDLLVLSKEFIKPTQRMSESRQETIVNYLIAMYSQEGKTDQALTLLDGALAKDPKNTKLLLTKANTFLKLKKMDMYKATVAKVLELDPNNAELTFNIGVSEDQLGNQAKAREYYEKAIALDPEYADAYNNIAAIILSKDQTLMDEMNSLGNSSADYDRYDTLKAQRKELYKKAKPFLEKTLAIKPKNIGVAKTLYNIHQQLGEDSKADAMKAKIDALESSN